MIYFIEDVLKCAAIGLIYIGLIHSAAIIEAVLLATRGMPV